jgi:competence protein ComEA
VGSNSGTVGQGGNTSTNKASKVNINKATIDELKTLSGVGDSTAKKIIDYREKNGNFKTIDDLKNLSGIGNANFDAIKDMIAVK